MNYLYVRRSKDTIDAQNQVYICSKYADENNFAFTETVTELITGNSNHDDRQLFGLIEKLKPKDRIVFADVSRIGRRTMDVMEVGSKIMKKKAQLICVENNLILSDDLGSEVTFFALSLGARIYREMVSSKTKTGQARAVLEGKQIGRKKGEFSKKLDGKEKEVNDYLKKGLSVSAIAKLCDVTRQTMAKFIESIKEPAQQ